MYDQYGFIVNRNRAMNMPCDEGDSTFFMGIQALMHCLIAELAEARGKPSIDYKTKAWGLWCRCFHFDWQRHPTKDDTSFDMMVIWDFVVTRFPELCFIENMRWHRPPFHRRKSKYWSGRWRARWMFWRIAVIAHILYRLIDPAVYHEYYKSHLLMLKAGTAYNLTRSRVLRWFMRKLIRRIERKTNAPNPFFRWIAAAPCGQYLNWGGSGLVEWPYQRDKRLCDHYSKVYQNIEFHREDLPSGKLHMSDQFLRYIYYPGQLP